MSLISLARRGRAIALIAGALLLVPIIAEAAPGGRSFGSRGSRSQSQVAPTPTAPGSSFQRSPTQAPGPSAAAPAAGAAGAAAQAARPSMARSLMMGVAGGLLGAGLFGLLSGAGFGGIAGFLGLLFQVALIGGLIWLALRLFRRRSEPQLASAGGPLGREAYQPQPAAPAMGGGAAAASAAKPVEFELQGADYGTFERLLSEVQSAISDENIARLRQITTPEISGALEDEFAENARKGLIEKAAEVKLLQGDLAESWREDGYDYATVAMRFSLLTAMVERNGGKVVEGHATIPREVIEHWTFVRSRGGEWKVAAIQPVE
ncbi:TIM44-like domain-containing protein [Bosea sp. (in: a-proteobacteria)]|jgi:predicted lipid-binding transport protein (Tim44 family)|uniref:TIM44-like domain-containing protein n=1 Tax=Bosea sp. (in: a-proteobacteria) TaxID=1871050 RepID=UPI002DDD49E4|nr:TIM44-like domain-containing protein [Bosea sp. (in: a-proteobacteria)]HEV2508900.1 TIM44-like domain-containing protein [Bosea sp. (in: a-proteobacteria)]